MTDYAQEQADELEALTSIFMDDLQGGQQWATRLPGDPPSSKCSTISAHAPVLAPRHSYECVPQAASQISCPAHLHTHLQR